jgi:hypothetical protein
MGQDTGALREVEWRDETVGGGFGGDGALVAVTERIAEGSAVGAEANIVDTPGVDGDGGDAFRGVCGSFAETGFKAGEDGV